MTARRHTLARTSLLLVAALILTTACISDGADAPATTTTGIPPAVTATNTTTPPAATATLASSPTITNTTNTAPPSITAPTSTTTTANPTATMPAAGMLRITHGWLDIEFDDQHEHALEQAGVTFLAVADARQSGHHEVELPVVSGSIDQQAVSGRLEFTGGIAFKTAADTVQFDKIVLDLDARAITAELDGQSRHVFDLDLSHTDHEHHQQYDIGIDDIHATLATDVANILAARLKSDVFRQGLRAELELKLATK